MSSLLPLLLDPAAWAALLALVVLEVVLGIDNLIFISIVTNKLPEAQRPLARRVGISLALGLRLVLLAAIAWLVGLTEPVFDLGITGELNDHGIPVFETAFSWRDLILIAGGLFLVWKSTTEIHHSLDAEASGALLDKQRFGTNLAGAIVQIILLDMVFSIDSILTAIGMTDHLPIMVAAVIIAVTVMLVAAGPVSDFINKNPTVVMLALSFLLMIGMVLIADGFGVHVPKGYVYAAMAFSMFVEALNMIARGRRSRLQANGSAAK
ncbi:MAG: TerC family protein [Nitratireductor sp.]|nr:TerC family protein [Nitratireductor sp.]